MTPETRKMIEYCQSGLGLPDEKDRELAKIGLNDWFWQSLIEEGHLMDGKHEEHLARIKAKFSDQVDRRYRAGNAQHGGFILDKPGLLDEAIEECVDQYVYLISLKEQLTK